MEGLSAANDTVVPHTRIAERSSIFIDEPRMGLLAPGAVLTTIYETESQYQYLMSD
jgi:hypothetical protein